MDRTAKNGIRVTTKDVTSLNIEPKGMIELRVPGYQNRTILFSTEERAKVIGQVMIADFNGDDFKVLEDEKTLTVIITKP
jgi:hypothetical protein